MNVADISLYECCLPLCRSDTTLHELPGRDSPRAPRVASWIWAYTNQGVVIEWSRQITVVIILTWTSVLAYFRGRVAIGLLKQASYLFRVKKLSDAIECTVYGYTLFTVKLYLYRKFIFVTWLVLILGGQVFGVFKIYLCVTAYFFRHFGFFRLRNNFCNENRKIGWSLYSLRWNWKPSY